MQLHYTGDWDGQDAYVAEQVDDANTQVELIQAVSGGF